MSDSRRRTGARVLGVLLFAGAIGLLRATAQSDWAAGHHWLNCDVEWILSDYREGPDFTVKVWFREQPISGVKVALTNLQPDEAGRYAVATGVTDSEGGAHFSAIPPGEFIAHVEEGLLAESQALVVEPGSTRSEEVRIEWPSAPIVTRAVRGQITSWQKATPQSRSERLPLAHILIQLLDLRTAKLLSRTYTSADGDYEFPRLADGLYVLRVSEHPDPSINGYDKAVEVATGAVRESMPGLVVDNGCEGLFELTETASGKRAAAPQVR